jgi:AcrR family transcriptional regulator
MSRGLYHSPLRDERADDTRRRIRDAARQLFEEVGFTAATVTEIARRAGVSQATVYAVYGSKPGIVAALIDDLEERAEVGPRIAQMQAETDPGRVLALFAAANRAIFERGHVILRAAYDALGLPEVAALARAGDANRRQACEALVYQIRADGALRLGPKAAAETMWLLSSVEQYLLATDVLGWSGVRYERWLTEMLQHQLLAPSATPRG